MSVNELSVGIDYHLASMRVSVLAPDGRELGNKSIDNDVGKLVEYVSRFGTPRGVAIEACEGSAKLADEIRQATKWQVELCHPGYAKRMRHNPDKTDCGDAFLVADLYRVGYLPKVWLAPEELRDLRTLVRHRCSLSAQLKQEKLRLRAILRRERILLSTDFKTLWSKKGERWLKSVDALGGQTLWVFQELVSSIAVLKERIGRCVERLYEFAKKDPLIQELMKQPNIGILTATMIRAEIGTFTRFRRGKEFARFCALTPRNASSGARQADSGLVKAGNPLLKTILIQVGQRLCRYDPEYGQRTAELLAQGKKKCVVVAAITNRWARRLFYKMRDFELGRA